MISNLDPGAELFLANLNQVQERLSKATAELSSGKKISDAADAPDQISPLLELRAERQRNTQIQQNLSVAKSDADTGDNALASAIQLMDSATTLASEGTNFTQTAETRQSLAEQVQSIQEQMVAISQTSVQGRYIFSGDASGTASYAFDLNSPNAVQQLSNAPATTQIEDPAGGSFAASKPAQEIFDDRNPDGTPAGDNVFAALNNLRLALLSNDSNAISAAIDPLHQASTHLNSMEAFYGSVQNRIQAASDYAANNDTRLQTEISQIEDADPTSAALELSTATTQLQAAFEMEAKLPQTSLFNYLA
jgi:flagellar hook-associated protein 3 FlgL